MAQKALVNGLEEDRFVHRLRQKIHRALLHGADAQGNAPVRRKEDDGARLSSRIVPSASTGTPRTGSQRYSPSCRRTRYSGV